MDDERKKAIARYAFWGIIGLIVLLIIIAMFGGFSSKKNSSNSTNRESKTITLVVGDKYSFDSDYGSYDWTSSNGKVAIATSTGEIEALGKGRCEIVVNTSTKTIIYDVTVEEDKTVVVQSIKMSSNTIELENGTTYHMDVNIYPANATNDSLTWYSSNEEIAKVGSDGTITAVSAGSCMVTVKTSNGYSDTCLVKVKAKEEEITGYYDEITLDSTNMVLKNGITYPLSYKTSPSDTKAIITWNSSDSSVVKIEDGVITTLKPGSATITVSSGKTSAICYITVVEGDETTPDVIDDGKTIYAESIALNQEELTLVRGTKYGLNAVISPDNTTDKSYTWESSDETLVTVDEDGNIEALELGVAIVKATTANGKTAECVVTVVEANEEGTPEGITLSDSEISIYVGEMYQLTETITPDNIRSSNLEWSSSNTSVATVNNGLIIAVGEGTTTITVTMEDGKNASCTVNVSKKIINPIMVNMNSTRLSLNVNGTFQLYATIIPRNSTNKTITWTSSNSNIVSVNSNGRITAKKKGTATIYATASNGVRGKCEVVVN